MCNTQPTICSELVATLGQTFRECKCPTAYAVHVWLDDDMLLVVARMDKLQSTTPYQDLEAPISRPGCWAYPVNPYSPSSYVVLPNLELSLRSRMAGYARGRQFPGSKCLQRVALAFRRLGGRVGTAHLGLERNRQGPAGCGLADPFKYRGDMTVFCCHFDSGFLIIYRDRIRCSS